MKNIFIAVLTVIIQLFISSVLFAVEEKNIKPLNETKAIPETTNIHFTGKYCRECHFKKPAKGRNSYLKYNGDYNQLCRCHINTPDSYLHPVNLSLSKEKTKKIPKVFPLENDKMTCLTCHNIYLQCQKSLIDQNSLRGAPYQKRTDFCYKCHDAEKYKRLDPHEQLDQNGEVILEKCLYCHNEKPDEKNETYKDVKLIGDLAVLCQRCHAIGEKHSGDVNHLRKPSEKALKRMEKMRKRNQIILPLDEEGKLTCITCHNPHEKGVLPSDRPSAKGADTKFRHRAPGKMCQECHQK